MITATFPFQKERMDVLGQTMAYVDVGDGDPILFLHGNPASSYLWRNVIPYLQAKCRYIAFDLLGMGDSAKLPQSGPESYTFIEHRRYLDALLEALNVDERVTLVIHDWGSALGFDWANRHREAVKGIAYMEAMALEQNIFVEVFLPRSVLRTLTDEEMAEYRRPFAEPGEGRRPTLTWPRQIPIDGEPADVAAIVSSYGEWLAMSPVPKLFIKGEPGLILSMGPPIDFCRRWPAQTEVTVPGIHFLQEDSPDEIGHAIAGWLDIVG